MSAAPHPRVPLRATYRLQLNRDFGFDDAAAVVPYLARLGISHAYVSPILKSRSGSSHGYDVIDHSRLDPELGGADGFARFTAALVRHDMGLIVDVVPNHVGVFGDDSVWWLDVLENGPVARHAKFFDIDWQPERASMHNRLLVPVLGAPYGDVLERGELQLLHDAETGAFGVRYHEHLFPIDPREFPRVFSATERRLHDEFPPDDPDRQDLESLLAAFARLPARTAAGEDAQTERYRDKEAHKRRLVRLCERAPRIAQYLRDTVAVVNGHPGDARSFDALDTLLDAQAYRLSYWRVATDEINYRRFFDVNQLAALRMDDHDVFAATHALILDLADRGLIDGLRIDHPDGLYDPREYFARLRASVPRNDREPLYVVAEKILAAHERLPEEWAVNGTTGYEFASLATAWLVNCGAESRFTRIFREYTGCGGDFAAVSEHARRRVMRTSLAAEISVLAGQLDRIAQLDRHTMDFTRASLRDAIVDVIAAFPVYRTYVTGDGASDEDRRTIQWALNVARKRSRTADTSVLDFVGSVLEVAHGRGLAPDRRTLVLEFAMKFQQVTAPVMAKGVEDMAFYRFQRLTCLNEVGSDPQRFGVSSNAVHAANAERARHWPTAMLATSTHDTKRSEDVRARIAVLSEMPDTWQRCLARWTRLNRTKRRQLADGPAPDRGDECLLYQTLLGTWPADGLGTAPTPGFVDRIQAYMRKAAREAATRTSWLVPDTEYEAALDDFIARLLTAPAHSAFLRDIADHASRVAYFGGLNSLAQTALKLTSPGIPDVYQGAEQVLLTLVDPDNRRAVDFGELTERLRHLERRLTDAPRRAVVDELARQPSADATKLFVTRELLALRATQPALGAGSRYEPLRCSGAKSEHVCAFARVLGDSSIVTILPRWPALLTGGDRRPALGEVWLDTSVEWPHADIGEDFVDAFTHERATAECGSGRWTLALATILNRFPLAVLSRSSTSD